jgi:hypothetical protein
VGVAQAKESRLKNKYYLAEKFAKKPSFSATFLNFSEILPKNLNFPQFFAKKKKN